MKRILFVEDNEVLLQLYGVMLADEGDGWETTTVSSGEAALALLRESAFDVVASDMQMPGINGIQLLTEVRKLHPQTSRIIISGVSDQGEAAASLNSTHLFLPKPFDVRMLKATLARIRGLDAYLQDDKLRRLAGKLRSVPSFPQLYLEIVQAIESPHASLQSIAQSIAQDPGITAKMLQVANSAAIGLPEPVNDPFEAVQQLGLTTVRSLVLSAKVYQSFKPAHLPGFSVDALWAHLMKCGLLARVIMCREGADFTECEDAFTAGILHDIGSLMLADSLPDEFEQALRLTKAENLSQSEAELAVFGATHAGLAAYLLGLWGLPTAIVEAVAFHHTPEKSDLQKFSPLTAVHVADVLTDPVEAAHLQQDYLSRINLADRFEAWRDTAETMTMEPAA